MGYFKRIFRSYQNDFAAEGKSKIPNGFVFVRIKVCAPGMSLNIIANKR